MLAAGQTVTEEYKADDEVMTGTVKAAGGETVKEYKLIGTEKAPGATIGDVKYATITLAAASAADGDVIVVGKDAQEEIVVPEGKNITIDFAGHRITGKLTNNGEVILRSSVSGGNLYRYSTAAGADPIIDNGGTLTINDIDIRNEGTGSTQANGINNKSGGVVNFNSGVLRGITYGTGWAHAIINAGELNVTGGDIQTFAFGENNGSNIIGISMTGTAKMTMTGGNVYAQTAGKSVQNGNFTVAGIRLQGTSQVTVKGGTVKAVANNPAGFMEPFGIYLQSAGAAATVDGGKIYAETYNDYAFGVKAENGTLDVTGGKIYAAAYHNQKSPNIMGVAIEKAATVNVSGGYLCGYSQNAEKGETYGVRNRGTLNVSGGAFGYNKSGGNCSGIYTNGGTTNYADGVKLINGTAVENIAYAAKDGDVIVEQRDGDRFIGVDVMRDGKAAFSYNEYDKKGYVLNGFKTAGGETITKADFADLTDSTVLDAVYGKVPTYLFLGSSVTFGHANHESSFVNYIASMTDCKVIKEAVSGTTLTDSIANSYVDRLLKRVSKTEKIDHLIVQLSTNDATRDGVTIGTVTASDKKNLTDFNKNTTVGAMEYIIAYAKETWGCKVSFYTNPKFNNANYVTLLNRLDEIKAKWDIGVLDFYNYKDMESLDDATLSSYMADPIHPNAMGYEWMAKQFVNFLNQK